MGALQAEVSSRTQDSGRSSNGSETAVSGEIQVSNPLPGLNILSSGTSPDLVAEFLSSKGADREADIFADPQDLTVTVDNKVDTEKDKPKENTSVTVSPEATQTNNLEPEQSTSWFSRAKSFLGGLIGNKANPDSGGPQPSLWERAKNGLSTFTDSVVDSCCGFFGVSADTVDSIKGFFRSGINTVFSFIEDLTDSKDDNVETKSGLTTIIFDNISNFISKAEKQEQSFQAKYNHNEIPETTIGFVKTVAKWWEVLAAAAESQAEEAKVKEEEEQKKKEEKEKSEEQYRHDQVERIKASLDNDVEDADILEQYADSNAGFRMSDEQLKFEARKAEEKDLV